MDWFWELILRDGMEPPSNAAILLTLIFGICMPIYGAANTVLLADAELKEAAISFMAIVLFELFLLWLMVGKSFWWSVAIKNWLAS